MVDAHLAPDWLTTAWLSEVLGHEVTAMSVKRIGDGLVGMNLRLGLTYGSADAAGPATVVAKLPSPDPTSRATGIALRNYEREVLFYRDLASTVDIRVAQCHHADWDPESGDFVLILEDLSPAAQGNQITGCTVEQARTAVVELAKLHGPRWADPTLDGIEWLSRRTDDDVERLSMLWGMFVPGFLGTYGPHLSPEAIALVEAFGPRLGDWVNARQAAPTVTHGDYRLDNLMFATPDGGYPVATVDWQSPGHGPALGDVSYFLGAGLLVDDRRAVERDLVAEYGEALGAYGVRESFDHLWEEYRRDAFAGVIMSVVASQIVGESDRSGAMFTAMATRHTQHALDLDSLSLF
jgi:hypothetical protein